MKETKTEMSNIANEQKYNTNESEAKMNNQQRCGVMGAFHCPHQTTCGCDCPESCQFKVIGYTVSSVLPDSLSKESEVK